MYRIKRFSETNLEQREFNRRTKLKAKLDRSSHNAEMHANRARNAEAKAEAVLKKATTPKEATKGLKLYDKAEKAQKSALNGLKVVKDNLKKIDKVTKSPVLELNSGAKVEKFPNATNTSSIVRVSNGQDTLISRNLVRPDGGSNINKNSLKVLAKNKLNEVVTRFDRTTKGKEKISEAAGKTGKLSNKKLLIGAGLLTAAGVGAKKLIDNRDKVKEFSDLIKKFSMDSQGNAIPIKDNLEKFKKSGAEGSFKDFHKAELNKSAVASSSADAVKASPKAAAVKASPKAAAAKAAEAGFSKGKSSVGILGGLKNTWSSGAKGKAGLIATGAGLIGLGAMATKKK